LFHPLVHGVAGQKVFSGGTLTTDKAGWHGKRNNLFIRAVIICSSVPPESRGRKILEDLLGDFGASIYDFPGIDWNACARVNHKSKHG
jgi:hypothetical protein